MDHLRLTVLLLTLASLIACDRKQSEPVADLLAANNVSTAAVAMPDEQSAQVAADVLKSGGNAVDAAVAAGFALAVTQPEAGNIGGGGFMLIYLDNNAYFVDYREAAPLAAHRDMYLDEMVTSLKAPALLATSQPACRDP